MIVIQDLKSYTVLSALKKYMVGVNRYEFDWITN